MQNVKNVNAKRCYMLSDPTVRVVLLCVTNLYLEHVSINIQMIKVTTIFINKKLILPVKMIEC